MAQNDDWCFDTNQSISGTTPDVVRSPNRIEHVVDIIVDVHSGFAAAREHAVRLEA